MNKEFTKQVAKSLKVPVLNSRIYSKEQILQGDFTAFPVSFLKPCSEGSTICCVKFEAGKGLSDDDKMEIAKIGEDFFLIEEFFAGFDVTIGVLAEKTIGGVEIRPKSGYYDYLAKYTKGQTDYFLPPRISDDLLAKMEDATLKIHNAIGAKSVSRADFLVKGDEFRFLEINTHPGFTETSLVPKMAKARGISFEEVVDFLIKDASFKNYNK
jgi:D-alanine-D-alanine ligase